jgi:iron-sulfur cluster assembly protein
MLTVTSDAIDAIKAIVGPGEGGLRISAMPQSLNGNAPGLVLEPAPAPADEDEVIEAEGAQIYVEDGAMEMLEGKVLDAEDEGDGFHFSVIEQP